MEKQLDQIDIDRLRDDIKWLPTFMPRVRMFIIENEKENARYNRLLVEFAAKLINRVSIFNYLEPLLIDHDFNVNSDAFREEAKSFTRSNMAINFHSRICGSLERAIPDIRVSVDERLASLILANEHDSNRLFDRIMLGAVLVASSKAPVELDFFWDDRRQAVLINNEDGQLAKVVRDTFDTPHHQPPELQSIPDLAMRVAPPALPWEVSKQLVSGSTLFLPLQLARCVM